MATGAGYYRMHRGWMDSPALGGSREPLCRRAAWCWLIERAAWKGSRVNVAGRTIPLERGQLTVSLRYLAEAWGWSVGAVRRFIERLKTDTMIGTDTGTGQFVITICNYSLYQAEAEEGGTAADTPSGTGRAQDEHKRKEGKKGKKESMDHRAGDEASSLFGIAEPQHQPATQDGFEQWWAEVPRKVSKGQARLAFKTALRKAGSLDVLVDGIRRYAASVQGKDAQYVAHPSTWLNGERWTDDLPGSSTGMATSDFDREWAAVQARGPDAIDAFLAKHRGTAAPGRAAE